MHLGKRRNIKQKSDDDESNQVKREKSDDDEGKIRLKGRRGDMNKSRTFWLTG